MRITLYNGGDNIWENENVFSNNYVFEISKDSFALLPSGTKHLHKLFRLTYNLCFDKTREYIILEKRE